MTTKDYVYLGLILLAALAFYCNGFYAGVYRCKKMYDNLLDDGDSADESSPEPAGPMSKHVNSFAKNDKIIALNHAINDPDTLTPRRELRGNFGNN